MFYISYLHVSLNCFIIPFSLLCIVFCSIQSCKHFYFVSFRMEFLSCNLYDNCLTHVLYEKVLRRFITLFPVLHCGFIYSF